MSHPAPANYTSSWSMDVALNRKRSKLAIDDDNDEKEEEWRRPAPSPALPTFSDSSKRSRAKDELEELDLIRPEEAWGVDVQSILSSNTLATPLGSRLEAHNNARNYQKDDSIIILCVQGNIKLHYDLLWQATKISHSTEKASLTVAVQRYLSFTE
jgi:hypothetical protein